MEDTGHASMIIEHQECAAEHLPLDKIYHFVLDLNSFFCEYNGYSKWHSSVNPCGSWFPLVEGLTLACKFEFYLEIKVIIKGCAMSL